MNQEEKSLVIINNKLNKHYKVNVLYTNQANDCTYHNFYKIKSATNKGAFIIQLKKKVVEVISENETKVFYEDIEEGEAFFVLKKYSRGTKELHFKNKNDQYYFVEKTSYIDNSGYTGE